MAPLLEAKRETAAGEASQALGRDRPSRLQRRLQDELDDVLRERDEDWAKVRDLMVLSDGLQPNYTDTSSQMTTLMRCAYAGETDILNWCIQKGANVNAVSAIGRSALHYACNGNRLTCLRMLLERGADPNLGSLAGETPLHVCCMYNCYEAALELLHGTKGVIEIDAEDSRRLIPESVATDKKILRAIRKYRATFEERRKADLIEHGLQRAMIQKEAFKSEVGAYEQALRADSKNSGGCAAGDKDINDFVVHLGDLKNSIFKETMGSPKRAGISDDFGKALALTPRFKDAVTCKRSGHAFRSGAQTILGLGRMMPTPVNPRVATGVA